MYNEISCKFNLAKLTNGTLVANPNTFWSNVHGSAILRDESGGSFSQDSSVKTWTGTSASGNRTDFHCNNWTSASGDSKSTIGLADVANDGKWVNDGDDTCDKRYPIYCISL